MKEKQKWHWKLSTKQNFSKEPFHNIKNVTSVKWNSTWKLPSNQSAIEIFLSETDDEPFIITNGKRDYSYFTASEMNTLCSLC